MNPDSVPTYGITLRNPERAASPAQAGTLNAKKPIDNLTAPPGDVAARDVLKMLNERHLEKFPGDFELSARIASYELAAKMQLSVPEVSDLSKESAATQPFSPAVCSRLNLNVAVLESELRRNEIVRAMQRR